MHNAKEIVNLQSLLVLIDGYVDRITKYYYIIERVYLIYRLLMLFISTFYHFYHICHCIYHSRFHLGSQGSLRSI